MLVCLIYHPRREVPYFVNLATVMNESVVGGASEIRDHSLDQTRVVNLSVLGSPTVSVSRRYLSTTRLVNTSVVNNKVAVKIGSIVQSRVTNVNQVFNVALVYTKRYLVQTRVVNTSTFGAPSAGSNEGALLINVTQPLLINSTQTLQIES